VTTKSFGCSIKWADKENSARDALERWAREEVALRPIDEAGIGELIRNGFWEKG
jgi:hypothetical protein